MVGGEERCEGSEPPLLVVRWPRPAEFACGLGCCVLAPAFRQVQQDAGQLPYPLVGVEGMVASSAPFPVLKPGDGAALGQVSGRQFEPLIVGHEGTGCFQGPVRAAVGRAAAVMVVASAGGVQRLFS